jgi:hypothetical protein
MFLERETFQGLANLEGLGPRKTKMSSRVGRTSIPEPKTGLDWREAVDLIIT